MGMDRDGSPRCGVHRHSQPIIGEGNRSPPATRVRALKQHTLAAQPDSPAHAATACKAGPRDPQGCMGRKTAQKARRRGERISRRTEDGVGGSGRRP